MAQDKRAIDTLRVELSNLRDELAVIESSEIFLIPTRPINAEGVNAIRHRIAEIESILRHKHHCMHAGCKSWGTFAFDKRDGVEWYCGEHKANADN